jgi:hypothetical protein
MEMSKNTFSVTFAGRAAAIARTADSAAAAARNFIAAGRAGGEGSLAVPAEGLSLGRCNCEALNL